MEEFNSYKDIVNSSKIENEKDEYKILIKKAFKYHSKGDLKNAGKYYLKFIKLVYLLTQTLTRLRPLQKSGHLALNCILEHLQMHITNQTS